MAKRIFSHVDMVVTIRRTEDGGALARVASPSATTETHLSSNTVRDWLNFRPGAQLEDLARLLFLTRASPAWDVWGETSISSSDFVHYRLTFDVKDTELAALSWEGSLFPSIPSDINIYPPIAVRVSPVIPRVTTIALTLPLRFLQVTLSPQRASLPELIRRNVGTHQPDSLVAQAVQMDTCSFSDLKEWRLKSEWPTVEVLHFDRFPTLDEPTSILLTTTDPERPGTLGWLVRLADTSQTRLIVIHCNNLKQLAQARRLATALVNRGGPAVLVEHFSAANARSFYDVFYDGIIHDMPLDFSFRSAALSVPGGRISASFLSKCSLFVGAGRSEALRVSTLSEGLIRLADELTTPETDEPVIARLEVREMLERLEEGRPIELAEPDVALNNIQESLSRLRNDLDNLDFSHESGGLLPLAEMLGQIREQASGAPSAGSFIRPPVIDMSTTPHPRYVNSHLWSWSDGELSRLDQKSARLTIGNTYQLGVQIGPQDEFVRVYGATALLEEIFKWTPDKPGVWLEVGLTGLDFEVLGDPVQEIWLPRESASETIYFAIVPQTSRIAQLRLCLYYKSDLIQSFRLAAITRLSQEEDSSLAAQPGELARALDLPVEVVGDVGYLARLEYSITANLDAMSNRPTRPVSIVANDLDGRSVITVKGPDYFEAGIYTDNKLSDSVKEMRDTLEQIGKKPLEKVDSKEWPYAFGSDEGPNFGDEAKLKSALAKLATLGWQFYSDIVQGNGQKKLTEALQPEKQIIHVAHILVDKVIPWAVLYDRCYDPEQEVDIEDNEVAHDVCLVALPDETGALPVTRCGQDPSCLLHPGRCEERRAKGEPALTPETAVCPLHFWGFKHIIELPPQQVSNGQADGQQGATPQGHELRTCILTNAPTRMTAGIHAGLPLADKHLEKLSDLVNKRAINAQWESHRQRILKNLEEPTLDLIYFYCHARDIDMDSGKEVRPYLEFQDKRKSVGRINAGILGFEPQWTHYPLVFLNGCRTAGFSPKALSPFIKKLVEDRWAAGVIGTEISVWEPLADEMALLFLEKFLTGMAAGEALLFARRALLAQYNPLGLIYTLYAAANLRLDLDRDGKCDAD